jgi:hypothetical protein
MTTWRQWLLLLLLPLLLRFDVVVWDVFVIPMLVVCSSMV